MIKKCLNCHKREHFAKYGWKSLIFINDKLEEDLIIKLIGGENYGN